MTVVIWDLAEVLISGLYGIEARLVSDGHCLESVNHLAIGGDHLEALFKGECTEDEYLAQALSDPDMGLPVASVRNAIHDSFRTRLEDSLSVFAEVNAAHRCVLLSDHCKEWVQTIMRHHSFLAEMDALFWSFETGYVKRETGAFTSVLDTLDVDVDECIFIDDRADNVDTARSLGIDSIQFLDAVELRSQLVSRRVIQPMSRI